MASDKKEDVVSREEYERLKKEYEDLLVVVEKYNKHKESQKKNFNKFKEQHPEKNTKAYFEKNHEAYRQKQKEYYLRNKEKILQKKRDEYIIFKKWKDEQQGTL